MKGFNTNKRKLLVVEDNDLNREILMSIFGDSYDIIEATNGQEGLEALKENYKNIALVILDIQMPVMNGYEFLEMQSKDEKLKQIPVIVTTGDKQEEEKCLVCGASDFVNKPYNARILLRRVEALIRLRESTNQLQKTKYDEISGLYNRDFFTLMSDSYINDNSNLKLGIMLMKVEDANFISSIVGEKMMNKLYKHIGSICSSYEEKGLYFARFADDKFVALVDEKGLDYINLTRDIKNKIQENSPINNVRLKFAIYESINHDLKVNYIFNKLSAIVKTIFHDYYNNVVYFDEQLIQKEERLHFIQNNMENGIKNNEFFVVMQPKHNAMTGELVGCEALVRWIHPEKGFMSPGDFIPTFEENGFITKLDLFVLKSVCIYIQNRLAESKVVVPVSINLSRRDLALFNSFDGIDKMLKRYGVDKKYIHFEITESICGSGDDVLKKAQMIRDAGYEIEIDDFGSGYSSLGLITDIPMDYLKLDVSLIRKITSQKEVAKTIVDLAHILKVKTVAEGVETIEELNACKEIGCDYIQGYYFSKPLKADEFANYCDKASGGNLS